MSDGAMVLELPAEGNDLGRKAFDSIRVADQEWLGIDRFDKVCVAKSEGMKERQFMRKVFGFTATKLRGQRGAITQRFKELMAIPEVAAYVDALKDEDVEPWTETLYRTRADAQRVIANKMSFAAAEEDPGKDAVRLAVTLMEHEIGRPKEHKTVEHGIAADTFKRFEDAGQRIAGILSSQLRPEPVDTIIDAEVSVVGDGEREAGGVGGPGPAPVLPGAGTVGHPPERQPAEVDGGGRGGGEEPAGGTGASSPTEA